MKKKTFKEIYLEAKNQPTSAQRFIKDVASATKKSELTVKMWINGRQTPDELTRSVLASKFNVDANHLF